ncbi:DUF2760 domain-containing protein [Sorangium cellulosum]|uniref:DUF2760 domain-containing protein n=1 Tax=Sorangium cellulosum So0157-2 TaxID=1254432 RepID=S4Y6G1_SORCE|nr:DUF2760 domain-containing protein [Sorangium cellulosum]AGP39820.1 hypothetical protein SCE1572_38195 [Sorangium cellulosum So0157-2]
MADLHDPPLPWSTRLWFAFACFFRVLFDPQFAARAWQAREAAALPPAERAEPRQLERARSAGAPPAAEAAESVAAPAPAAGAPAPAAAPGVSSALQLLSLLQREGRLVDFLEQDIASFGDADVGVAARMVHEGCRKALRSHAKLAPVRREEEGAKVTLEAGYSPSEVKLIGNVSGSAPYRGVLRHRGWRADELSLPTPVAGHDASVIAPAEVEL